MSKEHNTIKEDVENIVAKGFKRLDEPIINRQIVLLFLEKLELLNESERAEILKVIQLLNHPSFIVNEPK